MPTYEYECTNGHSFEVVQRITEDPLKRCKVCRAKAQRLISASNFILKGGGWYSDGYSSSKSGDGNGSTPSSSSSDSPSKSSDSPSKSSDSPSKSSESTSGSSESKPESTRPGDSSD